MHPVLNLNLEISAKSLFTIQIARCSNPESFIGIAEKQYESKRGFEHTTPSNIQHLFHTQIQQSLICKNDSCIALCGCVRTLELEREWGLRPQPGVSTPAPRPNHNDYRYNRLSHLEKPVTLCRTYIELLWVVLKM